MTFEQACETVGGGTPSTRVAEYWDGSITWVVPTDVTRNSSLALLGSARKITEKGLRKSSARMLPANAILMTSRASVGFFALPDASVCTNQGFINIIPRLPSSRFYLLHNLMSRVDEIRGHAAGSTYPEISKSRFRALPVVVPPTALRETFEGIAEQIHRLVRNLETATSRATEARAMLLPRLMNGDLEV
jgi:type I restriction enzyme S subunit